MKRVIQGQTYNTDTSALVALYQYEDEKQREVHVSVYQTRGGAFFEVHSWEERSGPNDALEPRVYFEPVTRHDLEQLMSVGNIDVVDEQALTLPPKAGAESEPNAAIYFRLPPALKNRVETVAKAAGLSINSWMTRCVERCLQS
jgi:hypothetical protein